MPALNNWALVVPLANEEEHFHLFTAKLISVLNEIKSGTVYLVIDNVSVDNTLNLCQKIASADSRFVSIWAPENRNVVDAYLRGYKEAFKKGHDFIIEMDAGLSHDPEAIPLFLDALSEGYTCVFGSRFIRGGSMNDSPLKRLLLSRSGTFLANFLLGTKMQDMTSGFQGFHANIVEKFLKYPLLSRAHFYQTELRYLLRKQKYMEVPIQYQAPSPRVSSKAITNSLSVLLFYFWKRISFSAPSII